MTRVETADQTCDGRDKNKLHSIYSGVPGGCNGRAKVQVAATGVLSTAERSYPTSEVRGAGREELPHVRGQGGRPRGDTQRLRSGAATRGVTLPRSGAAAGRRYPTPLSPRPGAAARRTNPMPWLRGHRRA